MPHRPFIFRRQTCLCGATVEPGNRRCRKCRARARWYRRKARRTDI